MLRNGEQSCVSLYGSWGYISTCQHLRTLREPESLIHRGSTAARKYLNLSGAGRLTPGRGRGRLQREGQLEIHVGISGSSTLGEPEALRSSRSGVTPACTGLIFSRAGRHDSREGSWKFMWEYERLRTLWVTEALINRTRRAARKYLTSAERVGSDYREGPRLISGERRCASSRLVPLPPLVLGGSQTG